MPLHGIRKLLMLCWRNQKIPPSWKLSRKLAKRSMQRGRRVDSIQFGIPMLVARATRALARRATLAKVVTIHMLTNSASDVENEVTLPETVLNVLSKAEAVLKEMGALAL